MHTNLRVRVAAAGAATTLALAGCGGGGGGKGDDAKREPTKARASATGTATATASVPGSTAGGTAAGGLDGAWIASATPGMGVVFTVNGKSAFLSESATGILCEGSATGTTIDLACPAGSKRTKGRVESVDAKKLKIVWSAGATETFDRYASAPSPTGPPAALPTDLPKLPPTP
ncbi:hypothetical protein [Streptomyces sp. NPDC048272]|uniref:hypothetical protein n=1 Tax=Streptomyces sp. NPDC048272 TaxID=3154616 RepID=UPI00342C3F4B